jgi:hypothetical protein
MGNNTMKGDSTAFSPLYEVVKSYDLGQYKEIRQKISK